MIMAFHDILNTTRFAYLQMLKTVNTKQGSMLPCCKPECF
jgi:hypothetical protein